MRLFNIAEKSKSRSDGWESMAEKGECKYSARRISGRSNCLPGTGQNLPSFGILVLGQDSITYSPTQVIGLDAKNSVACDFAERLGSLCYKSCQCKQSILSFSKWWIRCREVPAQTERGLTWKYPLLFQKFLSRVKCYRKSLNFLLFKILQRFWSGTSCLIPSALLSHSVEKSLNDKMLLVLPISFQEYEVIAQICISDWEIRKSRIKWTARLFPKPDPGGAIEEGRRSGRQQRQSLSSAQAAARDGGDTMAAHPQMIPAVRLWHAPSHSKPAPC